LQYLHTIELADKAAPQFMQLAIGNLPTVVVKTIDKIVSNHNTILKNPARWVQKCKFRNLVTGQL
jgi:hypothetical protein